MSLFRALGLWMVSQSGQRLAEYARVLLPIAVLVVLAIWLIGAVSGTLSSTAQAI